MYICNEDIDLFESDFEDVQSLEDLYSLTERDEYWRSFSRPELYNILIKTKHLKDRLIPKSKVSSRLYNDTQANFILQKVKEENSNDKISFKCEIIISKLINNKKPLYSFSKDNNFDLKDVISMKDKIDIVISKYRHQIDEIEIGKKYNERKPSKNREKKKTQYQIVADKLSSEGKPITFMSVMDEYYRLFNKFQYHHVIRSNMLKNEDIYPVTEYKTYVPSQFVEHVSRMLIENDDDITYEDIENEMNKKYSGEYYRIGYFTIYTILKILYRDDLILKFFGDMWFGSLTTS